MVSPNSISEIVLVVRDVPKAAAFYRDVVGLATETPATDEWAWFLLSEAPPQRLALRRGPLMFEEFSPHPSGRRFGPIHFALGVARSELGELVDRLHRAGVGVFGPVRLEWMHADSWYFYDPDGNLVEYWSRDSA